MAVLAGQNAACFDTSLNGTATGVICDMGAEMLSSMRAVHKCASDRGDQKGKMEYIVEEPGLLIVRKVRYR